MKKCKTESKTLALIIIDRNDIKEFNEKNGIILKRKYGKHDRRVKYIDLQ